MRVLLGDWKGSGPTKVGSGSVHLLRLQGAQELSQKGHAYQSTEQQQSLPTRSVACSATFVFRAWVGTRIQALLGLISLSFLSVYSFLFPFHLCLSLWERSVGLWVVCQEPGHQPPLQVNWRRKDWDFWPGLSAETNPTQEACLYWFTPLHVLNI